MQEEALQGNENIEQAIAEIEQIGQNRAKLDFDMSGAFSEFGSAERCPSFGGAIKRWRCLHAGGTSVHCCIGYIACHS